MNKRSPPGWRGTLLLLPLVVVSQVSLVNGGLNVNDDNKSHYPANTGLSHHTYVCV